MAAAKASEAGSNFPLGGDEAKSPTGRATATCYCGSVRLEFPTESDDGLIDTFICNCTDCRKISASAFCTNFIVTAASMKHLRGQEGLTRFKQNNTIASGNSMENHFCSTCGTLMYRISSGFPDKRILRLGTVDDFNLHETKLKPRIEQFCKDRVGWFTGGQGVKQVEDSYFG